MLSGLFFAVNVGAPNSLRWRQMPENKKENKTVFLLNFEEKEKTEPREILLITREYKKLQELSKTV